MRYGKCDDMICVLIKTFRYTHTYYQNMFIFYVAVLCKTGEMKNKSSIAPIFFVSAKKISCILIRLI